MNYRIGLLRTYLFNIINTLTTSKTYQINADFLGNEGDFSLNKIPTQSIVEKWVTGEELHRDVFSFRSRKAYSQDTINNLENIGFFEQFERKVKSNNNEGVLPDINGIQSIECLNCGTLIATENGNSAIFDIQIQITYKEEKQGGDVSL